jgi:hypothetical protein
MFFSMFVAIFVAAGPAALGIPSSAGGAVGQDVTVSTERPVPIPFSSNGCSGFREVQFFTCCYVHDLAYWAGGTWSDRSKADRALWRCVIDTSGERIVADIGYFLVRLGAIPGRFIKDGWGRAWYNTERGRFEPLTSVQREIVAAERARTCQSLRFNPANSHYLVDGGRDPRAQARRSAAATCRRVDSNSIYWRGELPTAPGGRSQFCNSGRRGSDCSKNRNEPQARFRTPGLTPSPDRRGP